MHLSLMESNIFGHRLDSISPEKLLQQTTRFVKNENPGYITFCNVHMIMEAEKDTQFASVLKASLLNLTDGQPLVSILKWRKHEAFRTAGPDMMPQLLKLAQENQWPVAFYGGSDQTLKTLTKWVHNEYPNLEIGISCSPPFRPLTTNEQHEYIDLINKSNSKLLFVGLGCPKQEKWMYQHVKAIKPLMFGVGGAFSMITGEIKRAPVWMQQMGLEWIFRFSQEPKRLWKRYIILNVGFIFKLISNSIKH